MDPDTLKKAPGAGLVTMAPALFMAMGLAEDPAALLMAIGVAT